MIYKILLAVVVFSLPEPTFAKDLYSEVFVKINAVRRSHGLQELKINQTLNAAAQSQADWMAAAGRMDHLREPARSFDEFKTCEHHPSNRVVKSGYFSFDQLFQTEVGTGGAVVHPRPEANENVGEIIARGWGGTNVYRTDVIVRGWMNSPGHRKEILKAPYREAGVGIASPVHGDVYWCVVFANR